MTSVVKKVVLDSRDYNNHVGVTFYDNKDVRRFILFQANDVKILLDEVVRYTKQHNPEWLEEIK